MNPQLAALAWALLILVLCALPSSTLPDASLLGIDKVGHFGMFFIGGVLWGRAWSGRLGAVLVGGVLLAVGTEALQALLSMGRAADPFDAVADVAGLLAGLGVLILWRQRVAV
ncbi:MAG: VanZ family protein [Rhodothermales bacterium]|nr:VanZ family protein [Rhodothermales bacterium]